MSANITSRLRGWRALGGLFAASMGCATTSHDPGEGSLLDLSAAHLGPLVRGSAARLVLVVPWATWCEPCALELPAVIRVARELRSRGVVMVLLSLDEPADRPEVLSVLRGLEVDVPSYLAQGDEEALARALSPAWSRRLPAWLIFDAQGGLLLLHEGPGSEQRLRGALLGLL